jgi:hypothetical protein
MNNSAAMSGTAHVRHGFTAIRLRERHLSRRQDLIHERHQHVVVLASGFPR